jgi:hypothetical protein
MTRAADLPDLLLARAEAAEREVAAWRAAAAGEVRGDMQADATLAVALEERTREVVRLTAALALAEVEALRGVSPMTALGLALDGVREKERADRAEAEVARLTAERAPLAALLVEIAQCAEDADQQHRLALAWGAEACEHLAAEERHASRGWDRVARAARERDEARAALATAREGAAEMRERAVARLEARAASERAEAVTLEQQGWPALATWARTAADVCDAEAAEVRALPLRGTR